jgi:hypothetical protein
MRRDMVFLPRHPRGLARPNGPWDANIVPEVLFLKYFFKKKINLFFEKNAWGGKSPG